MTRLPWLWPALIVLSAVAASLVTFVITNTTVRPIVVMWFLFVCPGMMLVRFFRFSEPAVEWTLAIALSFAVDALVAGALLYAGAWSPTAILEILIAFSLVGALVHIVTMRIGKNEKREIS